MSIKRQCTLCTNKHEVYYLVDKLDNKHLCCHCGDELVFLSREDGLDIPVKYSKEKKKKMAQEKTKSMF